MKVSKDLKKVDGRSFEEIVAALDAEGVRCIVVKEPGEAKGYFRDSIIHIMMTDNIHDDADIYSRIRNCIGNGRSRIRTDFYYARYRITPDFNLGRFGELTVRRGMLTERTAVRKIYDEEPEYLAPS